MMTATAARLGGWRAVSTVAALVLALLVCLIGEVGHAAQPGDPHSAPGIEAVQADAPAHQHDGSLADRLTHVAHCTSFCGHSLPQQPPTPDLFRLDRVTGWDAAGPEHLSGLPANVQDQPPRG